MYNEKYVIRIDSEGTRVIGWQVRFNRKGSYESKLFSDSIYGGKDESFEAAVKYRNQVLSKRGEGLETTQAKARVTLSSLPSNNTSGILGVSRAISKEKNGGRFPLWQTSFKKPDGTVKTHGFRVNKLGELKALVGAVEARRDGMLELFASEDRTDTGNGYIKVIDEYEKILGYLYSLTEDDSQTLIEFLASKELGPTSKKEMLERRIAQQMFRGRIMNYWSHKCAATGASAFIIASHIKPWAISNDEERVNLHNGLALSPNYDKAFDHGYITFSESGSIIVKKEFLEQAKILGISCEIKLPKYTPLHDAFMKYHRAHIYKGDETSNKSKHSDAVNCTGV